MWSTLPSHAAHLKTLGVPDFLAMVNAAFRLSPVDLAYLHAQHQQQQGQPGGQLDDEVQWRQRHTPYETELIPQEIVGVQAGSVASFPLKMKHADTYIGERVALIGSVLSSLFPPFPLSPFPPFPLSPFPPFSFPLFSFLLVFSLLFLILSPFPLLSKEEEAEKGRRGGGRIELANIFPPLSSF